MQFTPSDFNGIEIRGESVGAVLDGFARNPSIAVKYLKKYGLLRGDADKPEIDRNAWHPMGAWLQAHHSIAEEIGPNSTFLVGKGITKNAMFPPEINDIHSAIKSIDVAYHMNHRKNGKVMFDPATGQMLEGIGHYMYSNVPGEQKITVLCANPYPCDFDRGIVSAMALRFEPQAKITHAADAPCRKNGGETCTFVVTW